MSTLPDPTRIPRVLAELQEVWEAQPELSFPMLCNVLTNHGMTWGSSDEDLSRLLTHLASVRPSRIPKDDRGRAQHTYLVETESPQASVTISPRKVIVRRHAGSTHAQPVKWAYSEIRRSSTRGPLHIVDFSGVDHRLGIVRSIRRLEVPDRVRITGLSRETIGDRKFLITTEDAEKILVGRKIEIFHKEEREVKYLSMSWSRLACAELGKAVKIVPGHEKTAITRGVIAAIDVVEV
ncbi:hypothetical protein GP475_02250 [Corynebacterium poyangense]|uniref:Uncharacterized protein n=1 Tax=Corynebacterium poyangense TaxID=2684405 RepID=A0A7H0SM09_9CORY|nr:hypothetical protein [Corynebacterium poyangense]QNQ89584.1 hypothetical protein GP475_02250 [Corynebacterium poyangense]